MKTNVMPVTLYVLEQKNNYIRIELYYKLFVYKNINAHHPDYDCVFNWLLFDYYQLVLIL